MSLKLYQCLFTKNRWYKSGKTITKSGIVVHSSGANNATLKRYVQPATGQRTGMGMILPDAKTFTRFDILKYLGKNQYANDWNRADQSYAMHAFVGKLADGTVAAVQTLPWDSFLWGCGSGKNGSYNSTHIQFEICEDTTDAEYTKKSFKAAAELCAHLCKSFNIPVSKIVSHNEAGKTGYGSTHVDPEHWWVMFGYGMDAFRKEVQRILDETESTPEKNNPEPEKIETPVIAKASCYNSCYKKAFNISSPDGELNMRAAAGSTQPILKTLKNGDKVNCYGYFSTNGSSIWLYVIDKDGQEGFVSKKHLK